VPQPNTLQKMGDATNICAPTGERTAVVLPLASHFTDWDAPAYSHTLHTK
jgi:hypothetical protein